MFSLIQRIVLSTAPVCLAGCAAIDLGTVATPVENLVTACALSPGGPGSSGSEISFPLPRSVTGSEHLRFTSEPGPGRGVGSGNAGTQFQQYERASKGLMASLPPSLQEDDVAKTVFGIMIKTTAKARLVSARARLPIGPGGAHPSSPTPQEKEVDNYEVATSLSQSQLKAFAKKMVASQLKPTITTAATENNSAFSQYFVAYYEGKFVDRFGQSFPTPQLSMTVSDSEISAALTVMLEYTIDLLDTTPVLGDKPKSDDTATTFYPGSTKSMPTALVTNLATYEYLPLNGACGLTQENVVLLGDLATAAGNEASTLSALTTGAFGGFEVGLGFLGKFSFGDNQALTTIVKTAASRLAARTALATGYWAFKQLPGSKNGAIASLKFASAAK